MGEKKKAEQAEKNDKIFWAKFVPRITSVTAEAILMTTFFFFFLLLLHAFHFIYFSY